MLELYDATRLADDVARTVDTIVPIMEKALGLLSPQHGAIVKDWLPPRELLSLAVRAVPWAAARVDDDISDFEAALYKELGRRFDPDYSKGLANVTPRQLRDTMRQHYNEGIGTLANSLGAVCGVLGLYDRANGSTHAESARAMFLKLANATVKADGKIVAKEYQWLDTFRDNLRNDPFVKTADALDATSDPDARLSTSTEARGIDESLAELHSLIGLDRVKKEVSQLVDFIRVQKLRKDRGLPVTPVSHHLVFYGNPGTGKTTVARLIAEIYRALGILTRGHLVETDRSGLVAGYVGQTALKVRELTAKAVGGILFIDEAYALGGGQQQDFGHEAIETLLKLMEDFRSDFVVIVAGYPTKMGTFFESNPGLSSRFNRFFKFDDYSPEQLTDIFGRFCDKAGYSLTPEALTKVNHVLSEYWSVKDERFGNARLARNEFERAINGQASRIVHMRDIDLRTLSTIETADIAEVRDREV
jgi:SpoVK/Ycf46/Vps4 family AAA+-type ATPase